LSLRSPQAMARYKCPSKLARSFLLGAAWISPNVRA
jgi:hypothetical protein